MGTDELPPETRMGRVALRVNDLDRQAAFYRRVVGVPTVDRSDDRAILRAGGEPLVELIEAPNAPERPRSATGLFHVAIRVPDRDALADALARVRSEWTLSGAADHDASEAIYLTDPEGNGIELYRDRPRDEWPRLADGRVDIGTAPLDLDALSEGDAEARLPPDADVGHVHLEVSTLAASLSFYVDAVGFGVSGPEDADAAFLAAGDYHHHLALNTWNGRTGPAGDHHGLARFEVVVPDADAMATARERLESHSVAVERRDGELRIEDPDGIELRVVVED